MVSVGAIGNTTHYIKVDPPPDNGVLYDEPARLPRMNP